MTLAGERRSSLSAVTDGDALPRRSRPPTFADTKFRAPSAPVGVVRRQTLHDRLSHAESLPVTVVVGSGGSGKTTLLADWIQSREAHTVWLSADRGDADPVRFWRALVTALQRLDPTFGVDASDLITLDGDVTADAFESLLVDESLLGRRLTVVIDDAHLVSGVALEQLGHLVLRRPTNLRFVFGSRSDPAIGLPRLRLQGLVAEIREADLRMTAADMRPMLERIGLDVEGIDVDDLCQRTEGWAAGVQLAALSVVGSPDAPERLRALSGTHTVIASYLVEEVLANQPPHIHRFLEDTCVLDELDAAMCEVLLADDDGPAGSPSILLREVEEAHLFLSRVDAAGTVFRYHQLFADLLRDELRTRDPQRFRRQHRRAADAFLAKGDLVRAVEHMWKAGDRDQAAQLIARHPVPVYLSPSMPPPLDVVDYITDDDVLADSTLVGGYALALVMNARGREASELVDRVGRVVGFDNLTAAERINLLSLQAGARMLVGDTAAAARNLRSIVEAFERGETSTDEWMSVAIPVGARAAAWENDLDLAEKVLLMFRPDNDPHLERVDVVAARALIDHVRGDIPSAISAAETSIAAAIELGVAGSGADIAARAVLAASLVDRGDIDAADEHVTAVLESGRIERVPSIVLTTLARSRILRARGDYDGALGSLAVARSHVGDSPSTLSNYLDLAEFMVVGTLREVDRLDELARRVIDPLLAGRMRAWCHLTRGRAAAASDVAEPLKQLAVTPRQRFELTCLLARIAFERQSADFESLASDLVDLADQTGLALHIAESGTGVLQEVHRQARLRVRSDMIERLSLLQPLPRPAHRLQPHHPHDELSAREQIVLRYMATSMSNQEIAAELYLSVNTVKTHIKNVLRKMRATSRGQAVERARELNYL